MNTPRFTMAVFPGRYLQGPGALGVLDAELRRLGQRPIAFVDRNVVQSVTSAVGDVALELIAIEPNCTWAAIEAARAAIRDHKADVVAGIGGGKVIDTARAASHCEKVAFASVPTIVASDAPTSSLSVVYDGHGAVDRDFFVRSNPALVLVDSALVVEAPVRFFIAGIGDALSTWFEAHSCQRSGKGNILGAKGTAAAHAIARLCFDTILEFGLSAVSDCVRHKVTEAVERVIEANVLLSGIGFESGGVAAAHAIHHGLTTIDGTHAYLHGEKVALGVLASLFLEAHPQAEIERIFAFCAEVGLPVRLHEVGVDPKDTDALARCAARACRPGEIIHNEPYPVEPAMVLAALQAADRFGAQFENRMRPA